MKQKKHIQFCALLCAGNISKKSQPTNPISNIGAYISSNFNITADVDKPCPFQNAVSYHGIISKYIPQEINCYVKT